MNDDWQLLKDTLTHTPTLVISVSLQGPVGLLREGAALFYGLNEMLRHGSGYPLIDRLRQDLQPKPAPEVPAGPSADPDAGTAAPISGSAAPDTLRPSQDVDALRREVLERCRRANQVLLGLASREEAAYYRQGLLWVCLQTARAAREGGGFLGIGAVQVTDEEKEALRQVAYALGLPANQALVESLPEAPPRQMPAGLAEHLSPEEWTLVRQAPLWVGFAVITAHPSGPLGVSRELNVLPRLLQQARQQHPANQVLAAVWEDLSSQLQVVVQSLNADLPEPVQGGQTGDRLVLEHALQRLAQAAGVLDARLESPEALEFKQILLELARQVAEAAREGGFLGLGGPVVSPREQDVLGRIADILRV